MKQKITITIEHEGLTIVPNHLKKPPVLTLEIDKNLDLISVAAILNTISGNLIKDIGTKVHELQTKN